MQLAQTLAQQRSKAELLTDSKQGIPAGVFRAKLDSMRTITIRLGKRLILVAGSPSELSGVTTKYTPRGELALYLDA